MVKKYKKYINRIGNGYRETVCDITGYTIGQANKLLNEYNLSDSYGNYYISSREIKG